MTRTTGPMDSLNAQAQAAKQAAGLDTSTPFDVGSEGVYRFSDGRVFRSSTATTARQDMWVMSRLDHVGLEAMASGHKSEEELAETGLRLIRAAYDKDELYEIIAGLLVEDGVKWTQDGARANAAYFADLTDADDKMLLAGPIASLLLMYFFSGLASAPTSPNSSSKVRLVVDPEGSEASPAQTDSPTSFATPSPDSSSPGSAAPAGSSSTSPSAAGSSAATGTSSRAKSPGTTSAGSRKSSTGRSRNSVSPSST